jgi:hypothetical protein
MTVAMTAPQVKKIIFHDSISRTAVPKLVSHPGVGPTIFTNFLNVGKGRGAFDTWIGDSVMQRALLALFEFMRPLALEQR